MNSKVRHHRLHPIFWACVALSGPLLAAGALGAINLFDGSILSDPAVYTSLLVLGGLMTIGEIFFVVHSRTPASR